MLPGDPPHDPRLILAPQAPPPQLADDRRRVRLVVLSDTHQRHLSVPVPAGDVLVHCGDFCNRGRAEEAQAFARWFLSQPHPHKIVIAGNHDLCMEEDAQLGMRLFGSSYLCDTEVTVAGLRFYGSPWQPEFYQWAFNLPRGRRLRKVWSRIPEGIDVLVTHGPPHGILDGTADGRFVGCEELAARLLRLKHPPKVHVFGHIHEGYGCAMHPNTKVLHVNASVCTLAYQPTNLPTVLDLPK